MEWGRGFVSTLTHFNLYIYIYIWRLLMFAMANIKRFLSSVDCFLMLPIKKAFKQHQLCRETPKNLLATVQKKIEVSMTMKPMNIKSKWVAATEKIASEKNASLFYRQLLSYKKVESFNLLEIIIFYCNRNWETLAINTAFFPIHSDECNSSVRSALSVQCISFTISIFDLVRPVNMRQYGDGAAFVQCLCVFVDVSTQVVRHLYTKQSKFDGADTIQHTQFNVSFDFELLRIGRYFISLRHIFTQIFMHNTKIRTQNHFYFDHLCIKFTAII